jgi:hypothetical protein
MSTLNGGPGNIVTNGLVLYLDAANYLSYTSGSTTWNDLSGNNNSGSLVNGPTFSSTNAGSIVFDGVNDYIGSTAASGTGITNPKLYNNKISFNVWFRTTSTKNSQYVISSGAQTNSTGICLVLNDSGTPEYVGVTTSDKSWSIGNLDFITPNIWYSICVVTDDNNMYLYSNGTLVTSVASGGSTQTSVHTSLTLGSPNNNLGNPGFTLVGNIASTQIYNRALTASEVLQNYNATKARFGL